MLGAIAPIPSSPGTVNVTNPKRRAVLQAGIVGAAWNAGPWFIRDLRAADEIRVAGIHDVTGGLSIYGLPMANALTLAVEETNANGGLLGRPIRLIPFDPKSEMKAATELYSRYASDAATQENVSVVFGGITSAAREVIRPILRRSSTLYFYNSAYEGGVCDRNCFCTGATPAQIVRNLLPYAMRRFNARRIHVVAADYLYGQIGTKWVKKYALESGGDVGEADYVPLDVTEFGPSIAKIQAARPDMVMVLLVGRAHTAFYRQWAAAGMKKQIPIASPLFGAGNEQLVTTPDEHDGILGAYAYFKDLASPENTAFIKRYDKRFGDEAIPLTDTAMRTYYGFHLWAAGVRKAGSVDRTKVIEALEDGASFAGPSGTTTIHAPSHHPILDVYLCEAQNRRFRILETFSQQPPADTAAVCDLRKNPDDNQQYVIPIKV